MTRIDTQFIVRQSLSRLYRGAFRLGSISRDAAMLAVRRRCGSP